MMLHMKMRELRMARRQSLRGCSLVSSVSQMRLLSTRDISKCETMSEMPRASATPVVRASPRISQLTQARRFRVFHLSCVKRVTLI